MLPRPSGLSLVRVGEQVKLGNGSSTPEPTPGTFLTAVTTASVQRAGGRSRDRLGVYPRRREIGHRTGSILWGCVSPYLGISGGHLGLGRVQWSLHNKPDLAAALVILCATACTASCGQSRTWAGTAPCTSSGSPRRGLRAGVHGRQRAEACQPMSYEGAGRCYSLAGHGPRAGVPPRSAAPGTGVETSLGTGPDAARDAGAGRPSAGDGPSAPPGSGEGSGEGDISFGGVGREGYRPWNQSQNDGPIYISGSSGSMQKMTNLFSSNPGRSSDDRAHVLCAANPSR